MTDNEKFIAELSPAAAKIAQETGMSHCLGRFGTRSPGPILATRSPPIEQGQNPSGSGAGAYGR